MITYKIPDDFNLDKISALLDDINGAKTSTPYKVYGLIQDNNPTIEIALNVDCNPTSGSVDELRKWLNFNSLTLAKYYGDTRTVEIGLRRDIRAKPKFAAALLRTIISHFEGVTKLKTKYKIPKIELKPNGLPEGETY